MKKIYKEKNFLKAGISIAIVLALIMSGQAVIAQQEPGLDISSNPDSIDGSHFCRRVFVDDDFDPSTPGWGVIRFDKIQDGIDAVAIGGKVIVFSGTYQESLMINKPLKLLGEDKETTIIDASNSTEMGDGYGINILAGDVTISGFTIQNTLHPDSGIWIEDRTKNIEVTDNIFQNCSAYGVSLSGSENIVIAKNIFRVESGIHGFWSSNFATVSNNVFEDCGVSFYESYNLVITDNLFTGEYGGFISTYYSGNNVISGNNGGCIILQDTVDTEVIENKMIDRDLGIVLHHGSSNCLVSDNLIDGSPGRGMGVWSADNNTIVNNVITNCNGSALQLRGRDNLIKENHFLNNYRGISMGPHVERNTIIENTFEGHETYGIHFSSEADGCLFYHNNFINNGDYHMFPTGPNENMSFDNGAEGNYWDDYNGVDEDGDGIGDTPYVIGWSGYGYADNYPLMEPWG